MRGWPAARPSLAGPPETPEAAATFAKDVSRARKDQMKEHHPDKNGGAADATARAALINRAAEVLKDPASRAAYDAQGLVAFESGQWTTQLVTMMLAGALFGAICGYGSA